jgi:hypothetical protein
MVKTAEQLCPKRKCKKKRDWTPDMTSIVKKGKCYHWKWKQEGNIDNRESAISILCSLHATVTIIGSCVDKFVNSLSNVQYFFTLRLFSTK